MCLCPVHEFPWTERKDETEILFLASLFRGISSGKQPCVMSQRVLNIPTLVTNYTLSQVFISPNQTRSGLPCFVGGARKLQFWQETKAKVFFFPVGDCKQSAKYEVLQMD